MLDPELGLEAKEDGVSTIIPDERPAPTGLGVRLEQNNPSDLGGRHHTSHGHSPQDCELVCPIAVGFSLFLRAHTSTQEAAKHLKTKL